MDNPKPLVLIPGKINDRVRERVKAEFDCLEIERADASLVPEHRRSEVRAIASMTVIDAAFINAFENLSIISNFGVGYDGIDAVHAALRNVMVTNTPDVLTDEVADTTIALILNTLREFPKAEAYLRVGKWASQGNYPLTSLTLRGRTAGIFGLGRIGLAIARRLDGFDIPIRYHNRSKRQDISFPYRYEESLVELADAVDLLICVVPGGEGTEKVVNAEVFEALGPNGVFINVGRGSTVDEEAMIEALSSGKIAAAGLDVFADEPNVPQALLDLPNVCVLPHVASASIDTRNKMANLVVDNLAAWLSGNPALTPVSEARSLNHDD
ncbi:2-hydroxyacid dehydrogenase [Pseudohoeflea suaedae]|uniref:2-hydroxyacid dehydrogenase n=1 Tax=Pseudohoeflea suaedae TaxID=877384 RepID=A0A4R5PIF9_9HYPH|nr:2-hydroxyacid dehydrogenase [Pseudohoeflea suaedae]TDH35023.1 2-hydroxyacid dehydrogenase [Pseudohoeflea suaedae]